MRRNMGRRIKGSGRVPGSKAARWPALVKYPMRWATDEEIIAIVGHHSSAIISIANNPIYEASEKRTEFVRLAERIAFLAKEMGK